MEHKLPRRAARNGAYAHAVLAIVPVGALEGAKSRLSPVLAPSERRELVLSMLDAVLAACAAAESVTAVLVVTPEPEVVPAGVDVLVDAGSGHADAIRLALADSRARTGAVVVMADCPLVTAEALDTLVAAARPIALAPAHDGGINALATRRPLSFEPAFGLRKGADVTVARARAAGLEIAVVDDPLFALDIDRPEHMEAVILSRR